MRLSDQRVLPIACNANFAISINGMVGCHFPEAIHTLMTDGYHLAYHQPPGGLPNRLLTMTLTSPEGESVADAQVVVTVIDGRGTHFLSRAKKISGGYLIDLGNAANGSCHVEVEVITGGHLLTDYFTIDLETMA